MQVMGLRSQFRPPQGSPSNSCVKEQPNLSHLGSFPNGCVLIFFLIVLFVNALPIKLKLFNDKVMNTRHEILRRRAAFTLSSIVEIRWICVTYAVM